MGAWGAGVEQSDEFLDVVGVFVQVLMQTGSVADATARVREVYAEELANPHEAADVILALLDQQWTYGRADPEALGQASADGFGMENWTDASPDDVQARRESLRAFLARVSTPRETLAPIPVPKAASPSGYRPGDCISVSLGGRPLLSSLRARGRR